MWTLGVLVHKPDIEILLQFVQRRVQLLAERDAKELLADRLVKALDKAVGLRALDLGATVFDVIQGQMELIAMLFSATELAPIIGQDGTDLNLAG